MCERWLESFENFFADMGLRPTPRHSIDRIDANGNYEPSNCRWANAKTQRINQRRMVFYTHNGQTGTLKDLARHFGLSYTAVRQRVTLMGWPIARALATPVRHKSHTIK